MEKKESLIKKRDLSIVLNGGGLEMQGATIPVKWFFSEALVTKEPRYIVLVDLTEAEAKEDINYAGRRYVVEVEKAVKFLQVFKSGKHVMLALAIETQEKALTFLERGNGKLYQKEIPVNMVKDDILAIKNSSCLASAYVEFFVPKELFADKPETELEKLWFSYLFWPNRPKPKDECQVRKLSWFFALPKLPLFLIANILYAVYLPLASLILLYFGYQSIGIKEIISRIFHPFVYRNEMDVFVCGQKRTEPREIYRNKVRSFNETWFSPFHLSFFAVFAGLTTWLLINQGTNPFYLGLAALSFYCGVLFLFFILRRFFYEERILVISFIISFVCAITILVIGLFFGDFGDIVRVKFGFAYLMLYGIPGVFVLVIIAVWIKSELSERFSNAQNKKRQKNSMTYRTYLQENFVHDPEPAVDLKHLPDTFEGSRFKRDLTIKFWTKKADVCKPYES